MTMERSEMEMMLDEAAVLNLRCYPKCAWSANLDDGVLTEIRMGYLPKTSHRTRWLTVKLKTFIHKVLGRISDEILLF
jgi:hypothetical protein